MARRNQWNIEIFEAEINFRLNSTRHEVVNDIGIFVLSKLNQYVPVDTSYLKSRNRAETVIPGKKMLFHNDCFYAGYQEYGTRHQRGTPFFRPSVYNHLGELQRIAERGFRNGI
jgi:hypothetical protein